MPNLPQALQRADIAAASKVRAALEAAKFDEAHWQLLGNELFQWKVPGVPNFGSREAASFTVGLVKSWQN
jgi:hypothetical protein